MLHVVRTAQGQPLRSPLEDEHLGLAQAAASGDKAALRTLLVSLTPHILRVVRRVMGPSNPEVEDVAQECVVELLGALRRFRGDSSIRHFACRVALHAAMNARRKQRAAKRLQPDAVRVEADSASGHNVDLDSQAASRECVALVCNLCEELPQVQSEVLALHCVLGYTMNEVAEICNAPLETVRSRFRAARLALVARAMQDTRLREFVEESA